MPICSARRSESNEAFWKTGNGIVLIWLAKIGLGAAMAMGAGASGEGEAGVGLGAAWVTTRSSSSSSSRIGSAQSYVVNLRYRMLRGQTGTAVEKKQREGGQ